MRNKFVSYILKCNVTQFVLFRFLVQMYNGVRYLIEEMRKEFYGRKFLSHSHDCWTDVNGNSIIGTSIRIITKDMECVPIATGMILFNGKHGSPEIAEELKNMYFKRYGFHLSKLCLYSSSDNANNAKKVSKYLEAQQNNCEMHSAHLIIGYGIGFKENRGFVDSVGEDGKVKRVRGITTPGGPFLEGAHLIKTGEKIVNYFNKSAERRRELEQIIASRDLSPITLKNPAVTRVGSHIIMFQSLIANYEAIKIYFENNCSANHPFSPIYNAMTPEMWDLMVEIEGKPSQC